MSARWEHVTLQRDDTGAVIGGSWFLPVTKNERDHQIALSAFAAQQFAKLAALTEVDKQGQALPWVFPNTAGDGPVDVKTFGKQLADRQRSPEHKRTRRSKSISALALPGGRWTAHDLRRTAATIMARCGVSTDVIDECLNHKLQSRVARVYVRDRRSAEQAMAFAALGQHLQTLADRADGNNVVPLPGRAA